MGSMGGTESPTGFEFGRSLIPPLIDCWREGLQSSVAYANGDVLWEGEEIGAQTGGGDGFWELFGFEFEDAGVGEGEVAAAVMDFGGPGDGLVGGNLKDAVFGRGAGGEVAVASEEGGGIFSRGVQAEEIADVTVVKTGSEVGGVFAGCVGRAGEDAGHVEFVGDDLEISEGVGDDGKFGLGFARFIGKTLHGVESIVVFGPEIESEADLFEAVDAIG
ncbi:hypothetical protein Cflav_PD6277, partial [Pedosphaera parvula Ellin514]